MVEESRNKIPKAFYRVFWDVNPDSLDIRFNADFILERVLEYGTWDAVKYVREIYTDDELRAYLLRRGWKVLTKKTISFWRIILHMEKEPCLQTSSLNSNRPFWNY